VLDRQACEKFSGSSPSQAVEDLVSSITTKSTESAFDVLEFVEQFVLDDNGYSLGDSSGVE
jgi:hypothetical protein